MLSVIGLGELDRGGHFQGVGFLCFFAGRLTFLAAPLK